MGWMVQGLNSTRGETFRTNPDWSCGSPSLLYNGYWVFPAVTQPGNIINHLPTSKQYSYLFTDPPNFARKYDFPHFFYIWSIYSTCQENLKYSNPTQLHITGILTLADVNMFGLLLIFLKACKAWSWVVKETKPNSLDLPIPWASTFLISRITRAWNKFKT